MQEENLLEDYRIDYKKQEEWIQFLKQNGFVVIANFLPLQECQKYVKQFWDIMEFLAQGRLNRNDVKTQILGKNYPPVLHGGMIQYVGHSKPQWELRALAKQIFAKIWKTNDLATSFDGFCFMNGHRNYQQREKNSFLHVDQSPTKNYLWSYQGVMTLTDANENQGGFVCVPKSHKHHYTYFKNKKMLSHKENWYLVPEQDKNKQPLQNILKVNSKAGDFILFDSRTFHCNTVPTQKNLRICTYICMIPKSKIPQKTRQSRKKAFQAKRTSNHHAGDGFKTFPILPRFLPDRQAFAELVKKVNDFQLGQKCLELV